MDSLLQQLENNEAILLMYLADELPAADRAEVEQMLQNDAHLRAELESLRGTQAGFEQTMRAADASQPLPISSQAASRQVMRLVNHWIGQQLAQQAAVRPMVIGVHSHRWWLYPLAAAAMLLLGIILYSSMHQPAQPLARQDDLGSSEVLTDAIAAVHEEEPPRAEPILSATTPSVTTMAPLPARQREDLQMLALATAGADNEVDPFIGAAPTNHVQH